MVQIDLLDGPVNYRTYVEARKRAYRELTGPYREAYGHIDIYPNQHSNKPKEIMLYNERSGAVEVHRYEVTGIMGYTVQKNGELGRRI